MHGEGAVVGAAIIDQPAVNLISFTGSNAVGNKIAVRCAELGKPVSLEMGGKNAITILDDADLDLALEGVLWSAFGTTGQRCTAASRVLVHADVYDEFAAKLIARAKELRLGNGLEDTTDVGPVVNTPQLEKIASYMPVGADDGATLADRRRARDRRRPRWRLLLRADGLHRGEGRRCASRRRRSSGR